MFFLKRYFKRYFRTARPSKQNFYHYFYKDILKIKSGGWVLDMGSQRCKHLKDLLNRVLADVAYFCLKKKGNNSPVSNRGEESILSKLACPQDRGALLLINQNQVQCQKCHKTYQIENGIYKMLSK